MRNRLQGVSFAPVDRGLEAWPAWIPFATEELPPAPRKAAEMSVSASQLCSVVHSTKKSRHQRSAGIPPFARPPDEISGLP